MSDEQLRWQDEKEHQKIMRMAKAAIDLGAEYYVVLDDTTPDDVFDSMLAVAAP